MVMVSEEICYERDMRYVRLEENEGFMKKCIVCVVEMKSIMCVSGSL